MIPPAMTLVLAAGCAATTVTNSSPNWNEIDKKSLKFATERCAFLYPDSPCLKSFEKTDENTYRVMCSEKDGK